MATEALAGTGFHVENYIYSRMATDKIVIQGKYYFNSTPPLALTASVFSHHTNNEKKNLVLPEPYTYPMLIKANKTATILPGEGFFVPVYIKDKGDIVEIDPRKEAPKGFVLNHLQEIKEGEIHICSMSEEPVKIKKNTPICNIKQTRKVVDMCKKNSKRAKTKSKEIENNRKVNPMKEIKIDPDYQLSQEAKKE